MKLAHTTVSRRRFLASTAGAASFSILPGRSSGDNATTPNSALNIAFIGMGNQITAPMKVILAQGHNAVAFCDVDERQIRKTKAARGNRVAKAKEYADYRKLLEKEKSVDAVVIATPDHWHASICKAAMEAGKHVYCEKPLTHTIGEARMLRELTRRSKVVTQMGNQGSASGNMRRSIELIEAGIFGQITDIYVWHDDRPWAGAIPDLDKADPVPDGLNWDFWCGPARVRPYKNGLYHPRRWRDWLAYGNGFLGDFCCHAFNMPMRVLKLEYPERIEVKGTKLAHECYPDSCRVRYRFPARGNLSALTIHVYDGGMYPEEGELDVLQPTWKSRPRHGCLLQGERGALSVGLWNKDGYIKMNDEERFSGAGKHELAKTVPQRLPRVDGHVVEWLDAIKGGPQTFSDFETGGHLTEIGLAGIVALRLGKDIDWDGPNMQIAGSSEADPIVHRNDREEWL